MRILLTRSLGAHYEFKWFTFVFIIHTTTTVNRILSKRQQQCSRDLDLCWASFFSRILVLISLVRKPQAVRQNDEMRCESSGGFFDATYRSAFFSNEKIKSDNSRYLLSVFAARYMWPIRLDSISNCQSQAGFSRKPVKQSFINFFFPFSLKL